VRAQRGQQRRDGARGARSRPGGVFRCSGRDEDRQHDGAALLQLRAAAVRAHCGHDGVQRARAHGARRVARRVLDGVAQQRDGVA
jgi:hypothetical protein